MTYRHVGNSLRRIEHEFNNLTDYGNIKNVNCCFHIDNIDINLEQFYDNQTAIVINEVKITVKKPSDKTFKIKLLTKILPSDISHKIMNEYIEEFNILTIHIHIEYDPQKYPISPPTWKLKSISNIGFVNEIEEGVRTFVNFHNELLQYDWSCAITLRGDLNYFISKLLKLFHYI